MIGGSGTFGEVKEHYRDGNYCEFLFPKASKRRNSCLSVIEICISINFFLTSLAEVIRCLRQDEVRAALLVVIPRALWWVGGVYDTVIPTLLYV